MMSAGEIASGESQISNTAGDTGSACAETVEMEVFGYKPNGTSMGTEEIVGKEVQH